MKPKRILFAREELNHPVRCVSQILGQGLVPANTTCNLPALPLPPSDSQPKVILVFIFCWKDNSTYDKKKKKVKLRLDIDKRFKKVHFSP